MLFGDCDGVYTAMNAVCRSDGFMELYFCESGQQKSRIDKESKR